MIKKLFVALFTLAVLAAVIAGCGDLPRSAVAQVNGKVITRQNLDRAIEDLKASSAGQAFPEPGDPEYEQLQRALAEQLVVNEVVAFEAEKMDIIVTDQEINDQVEQIKEQTGGEEQFRAALASQNLTEDRLKDQIRINLLNERVFDRVFEAIEITDAEISDYYEQHKNDADFQKPETKRVRLILITDEATANQVKQRLDAGEDFGALAQEFSLDPTSKEKGGDVGDIPTTDSGAPPEIDQVLAQLQPGQTSAPVFSQIGYAILRVDDFSPAGQPTFDQAKEKIRELLLQTRQQEEADRWVEEAKARYDIRYGEGFEPLELTRTETQPTEQTQP